MYLAMAFKEADDDFHHFSSIDITHTIRGNDDLFHYKFSGINCSAKHSKGLLFKFGGDCPVDFKKLDVCAIDRIKNVELPRELKFDAQRLKVVLFKYSNLLEPGGPIKIEITGTWHNAFTTESDYCAFLIQNYKKHVDNLSIHVKFEKMPQNIELSYIKEFLEFVPVTNQPDPIKGDDGWYTVSYSENIHDAKGLLLKFTRSKEDIHK